MKLRKRFSQSLAVALAFVMAVSMNVPMIAWGDEGGAIGTRVGDVAVVGEKSYATLKEAVADAQDGQTVKLLNDASLDETLVVEHALTLDGDGKTITATGLDPAIRVNTGEKVSVSNLALTGASRGIEVSSAQSDIVLTGCVLNVVDRGITFPSGKFDGVNLVLDSTSINNTRVSDYDREAVYDPNARGISLWNITNSTVTLKNGSSINGFSYCVNVSGDASESGVSDTTGLTVNMINSTVRGWAALNVWGSSATYNIERSTIKGINTNSGGSNSFAALVFNDDIYGQFAQSHAENNTLNIADSTITNYQGGSCVEELLRIDCGITVLNLSGTVAFEDTTGNIAGALCLDHMDDPAAFVEKQVHSGDAVVTCTTVDGAPLAFVPAYVARYYWDDGKGGSEGCNCTSLTDVFLGDGYELCSGEFLDLLADASLTEDVTVSLKEGSGFFTFNLKGHSVGGGTITLPAGTSVKTDAPNNGLFVVPDNCALVESVENGVYTYSSQEGVVAAVYDPDGSLKATYASLKDAFAAAETTAFSTKAAPENATVVKLLKDANDGLDVGVSGRLLQNIVLDLDGHTLTLGPAIGSTGTETNGLRVLSYSKIEIKNGTVTSSNMENDKGGYVRFLLVNYGTMKLENVTVNPGETAQVCINNCGALVLAGETEVKTAPLKLDGANIAITNDVYWAHYSDFDASLTVEDPAVAVGNIRLERYQDDRGGNKGSVVLSIGAGTYGSVIETGGDFVGVEGRITGGTFASDVSAYFDGSIYSQNAQDAAVDPGAVVPRAYAIEYDLAGGSLPEGASNPASYTYFDDDIVLANPERVGYVFAGWTGTGIEGSSVPVTVAKHSSGDRSYVATWTPSAGTKYTVQHRFQDVEGDGYTLDESKTTILAGTTGKETAAEALVVPGFTAKAFAQQEIAADGSTVVEVFYDRNVHTVSYAYAGPEPVGASALPSDQQYRFGAPVVAAAPATAPGYSFVGWGLAENFTMPDEDVVLSGSFTAKGDTPYRVEHYRQALDGTYALIETESLTGETDTAATAAPKAYVGFAYDEKAPGGLAVGSIKGDGTLVLKLYYDRESYEVSYSYTGDVPGNPPALPASQQVVYGAPVTVASAPTMTGYDFSGWSEAGSFDMPASNVVVTGSWTAKSDVSYTVHYCLDGTATKLADDKRVDGRTFAQAYEEQAPEIAGYTVKGAPVQSVVLDAYGKEATFYYTADEARIAFEANGGTKVDDLVGMTGETVKGLLPEPVREGYAFAGWYADASLTQALAQLPAVFAPGTTTYYAKWYAVPLPDADMDIQVELPPPPSEGAPYASVPKETVKSAAEHAQGTLASIGEGEVPAGVNERDAREIAGMLEAAGPGDSVSVVVSLKFEEKAEAEVKKEERQSVEAVAVPGEEVGLYLDLGVEMTVKAEGASGIVAEKTAQLSQVSDPLLFEVHVDPALIRGKHVRIAHVHEGVTEIIYPESVDPEKGIVSFRAHKFSTYALLTSDTVAVAFESNGGSAVEAQSLQPGAKVVRPADPTREGYSFEGWYLDEELTVAYDFNAQAERPMTLYAKWAKLSGETPGGTPGETPGQTPGETPGGVPDQSPSGDAGKGSNDDAKPLPKAAPKAQSIVSTGDGLLPVVATVVVLVLLAGGLVVVAAIRRRSRR
ncbi:MAG: InlB B-repeat-containing protein [Eggerthella lenta]|nr:InlB B-repeat-containing protein [Eggerthella lenta]